MIKIIVVYRTCDRNVAEELYDNLVADLDGKLAKHVSTQDYRRTASSSFDISFIHYSKDRMRGTKADIVYVPHDMDKEDCEVLRFLTGAILKEY